MCCCYTLAGHVNQEFGVGRLCPTLELGLFGQTFRRANVLRVHVEDQRVQVLGLGQRQRVEDAVGFRPADV